MIQNLSAQHSLINIWMNELRSIDVQTSRMRFRRNMERIGEIAAYEISKTLQYQPIEIQTPLSPHTTATLSTQPVIATILRAGIPLFQGILNYFDQADAAFIAAYRKHTLNNEFTINQEYVTCPNLDARTLLIADPMLATGASLITALQELYTFGTPQKIHIITAIACKEGIKNVLHKYPDCTIWCGDIDEELTAKGYIVPGLGDAGDLTFGTKLQF